MKIDEFDIEGTLSFAEHLVSNASRLWIQAGLDQRQRLQKVFFPRRRHLRRKGISNTTNVSVFQQLRGDFRERRDVW